MNLLNRAQKILTGRFQEHAAVIQQAEVNHEKTVYYPAFIGSGSVMHALGLRRMRSPKIAFVERPALYRIRPGEVFQSVCHNKRLLAELHDIQHPALLEEQMAYLMFPESTDSGRALAGATLLQQEISQNPIDSVYICLDQRLTDEGTDALLVLLGILKAHVNAPIYYLQLTDMDPAESHDLLMANLQAFDGIEMTDTFQICDIENADAEYARYANHLRKMAADLQSQNRNDLEQQCVDILKVCRQSSIDQQRLIHVKQNIFPHIPSPATLAQRDHNRRATEIKHTLMGIFKTTNGKNGETLIKQVLAFIETAKKPGDFDQAALRAVLTINKGTLEALIEAIEGLNDSHKEVLSEYLDKVNNSLRKSGLPEIEMPPLAQFALNEENPSAESMELQAALMSVSEQVFRLAIGGSLGSGAILALAKLLAEIGILSGSFAGPPGQIICGGIGFVIGIVLSIMMIEAANARSLKFEYEKRVRESIASVAAETDRIFHAINVETNYLVYDTLMLIETTAKEHVKVFEEQVQVLNGKSEAELAKLLAELKAVQHDIETLLAEADGAAAEDVAADTTEADTPDDADTTPDADAQAVETDGAAAEDVAADTTEADTPDDADTTPDADAQAVETDGAAAEADTIDDADADAEDVDADAEKHEKQ